MNVGDPVELASQGVVFQSGEIQLQDQGTTVSALLSATTNKGCYIPDFQQSNEGFKCKNCGSLTAGKRLYTITCDWSVVRSPSFSALIAHIEQS
jgi:hypothetical protein